MLNYQFLAVYPGRDACPGVFGIVTIRIKVSFLLIVAALDKHDLAYEKAFIAGVYEGII